MLYILWVFMATTLLEMLWHWKQYPSSLTPMQLYEAQVHTYNLSMAIAQEFVYITMLIFIAGAYEKTFSIICIFFQSLNIMDWEFDFNWRTTKYDFWMFGIAVVIVFGIKYFRFYESVNRFTGKFMRVIFKKDQIQIGGKIIKFH